MSIETVRLSCFWDFSISGSSGTRGRNGQNGHGFVIPLGIHTFERRAHKNVRYSQHRIAFIHGSEDMP